LVACAAPGCGVVVFSASIGSVLIVSLLGRAAVVTIHRSGRENQQGNSSTLTLAKGVNRARSFSFLGKRQNGRATAAPAGRRKLRSVSRLQFLSGRFLRSCRRSFASRKKLPRDVLKPALISPFRQIAQRTTKLNNAHGATARKTYV